MKDKFVVYPQVYVDEKEGEENCGLGFKKAEPGNDEKEKTGQVGFWIGDIRRIWDFNNDRTMIEFHDGSYVHIVEDTKKFMKKNKIRRKL